MALGRYNAESFFTVIREKEFDSQLEEICTRYQRMSELDHAIDWALSRKPHSFRHISGDYYLWVTEKLISDDFPKVKILYKVDDVNRTVVLISIEDS